MITLEDPSTWPLPATLWKHRNGNIYRVELFTNIETARQEDYPTTIVYRNVENGKTYSRRLVDWSRSMTPVDAVKVV